MNEYADREVTLVLLLHVRIHSRRFCVGCCCCADALLHVPVATRLRRSVPAPLWLDLARRGCTLLLLVVVVVAVLLLVVMVAAAARAAACRPALPPAPSVSTRGDTRAPMRRAAAVRRRRGDVSSTDSGLLSSGNEQCVGCAHVLCVRVSVCVCVFVCVRVCVCLSVSQSVSLAPLPMSGRLDGTHVSSSRRNASVSRRSALVSFPVDHRQHSA